MNHNKKPLTIDKAASMDRNKLKEHLLKMFEEKNLWRLPYKNREEQDKAEKQRKAV